MKDGRLGNALKVAKRIAFGLLMQMADASPTWKADPVPCSAKIAWTFDLKYR